MQASKPSSWVTKRHFSALPAIPTALQPLIFPICPTTDPTAPEAAATTIVSPGLGLPTSGRPTNAVIPGLPTTPSAVETGGMAGPGLRNPPPFESAYSCQPP